MHLGGTMLPFTYSTAGSRALFHQILELYERWKVIGVFPEGRKGILHMGYAEGREDSQDLSQENSTNAPGRRESFSSPNPSTQFGPNPKQALGATKARALFYNLCPIGHDMVQET